EEDEEEVGVDEDEREEACEEVEDVACRVMCDVDVLISQAGHHIGGARREEEREGKEGDDEDEEPQQLIACEEGRGVDDEGEEQEEEEGHEGGEGEEEGLVDVGRQPPPLTDEGDELHQVSGG